MAETPSQTISWPIMEKHLKMLLSQTRDRLDSAEGTEAMRLQGEVRLLKRLGNLPETLALLDAEDRRVAEEKK